MAAESITITHGNRLYLANGNKRLFSSHPYDKDSEYTRKVCIAD